jgi:hypothetical protein
MGALSIAIALVVSAGTAHAQGVVLAPLAALGDDANSKELRSVERHVISGITAIKGVNLVPQKTLLAKVRSANRSDLRNCDGVPTCLAELGALLGAKYVVYGEVGGVGKVQVAYLKLIEVAKKREIRSTTLEIKDGADKDAPRAAAVRLLDPARYTGTLALAIDVDGASVYVDGRLATKSPARALQLQVGTHAIRVTHPEYRDFVRFVDVSFGANQTLEVDLQQYAIVASDMRRMGDGQSGNGGPVDGTTPWYRRWYTIAGAGAVVFIGSALVIGALSDGVDAEAEKTVR